MRVLLYMTWVDCGFLGLWFVSGACGRLVFSQILAFFGFFFFQAEDGIRDWSVTGVQTCALPISVLVFRRKKNTSKHGITYRRATHC